MNKYICNVCFTIYNPEVGDSEEGILPGTAFEELPENWVCPVCGSSKDKFKILPPDTYEKIFNKRTN